MLQLYPCWESEKKNKKPSVPSCPVCKVVMTSRRGVKQQERQSENRKKENGDRTVRKRGCSVVFLFRASFPRSVNQLRVTTKEPRGFFIPTPGSRLQWAGWDSWATAQLSHWPLALFPTDSCSCCDTTEHQLHDHNPPSSWKVRLFC